MCGSVEAKPGRFPRNERREIKVNLLESMMPFLSGGSRFDQCLGERHTCAIDLGTDFLGKPIVREAGLPRLSVSFSQGEALMWAAICQNGVCGVDSAHSEEFRGAYPFKRAFHEDEFESLSAGTDVSREEAAAILWSVKEAAVKALGCGFHLIDPLQMNVVSVGVRSAGLLSTAVVSGLGESIRELREQLAVHVVTFPFRTEWVSLAYEDVGLEW